MDLFAWTQMPTEQLRPDLVSTELTPIWIPDAHSGAWQWSENSGHSNYIDNSHLLPYTDTTIDSPESYRSESYRTSSFDGSNFDESPGESVVDYDIPGEVEVAGRPRCPVSTGRDPNENRIQRRRTQNRNSQRVYRQRRIEERNEFETRATTAEMETGKLKVQVAVLETEVAELGEKCKVLEEENVLLRMTSGTKRWKRSSSHDQT